MTPSNSCLQGHQWQRLASGPAPAEQSAFCTVCGLVQTHSQRDDITFITSDQDVSTPPLAVAVDLPITSASLPLAQPINPEPTVEKTPRPRATGDKTERMDASLSPQAPSLLGDATDRPRFGSYEILGELGRGGMGVVYQARQLTLNRVVALKMILSAEHADAEQMVRFRSEAEAVARMQHPNIVQIYDIGEEQGRQYFSLEYVAGGSLAAKLQGNPLPTQEAAQLTEILARAMHSAHQRGIIHRDLKPANILLTADGVPKITDFGLAKRLEEDAGSQTRTGAVMGTPRYMAPEQAAGRKDIGPLADVYALGAILYELLTGRPPFCGQTALDTLLQVMTDEPVPPSRLRAKLPRDLETICLKCLEKEPARRYAHAEALADDLHRFLKHEPIQAQPVGLVGRAGKWVKRNPVVAALLGLVVVVSAMGFGATVWQLFRTEDALVKARQAQAAEAQATVLAKLEASRAEEASRQAQKAEKKALEQAQTLRRHLYGSQMKLAYEAFGQGHTRHALTLLDRQIPRAAEADLRDFSWYGLWHLFHDDLFTLRGHPNEVTAVAFAPDGLTLVSGCYDGKIKLWNPLTGKEQGVLAGHKAHVLGLAFSPDGRWLASVASRRVAGKPPGELIIWDRATGKAKTAQTVEQEVWCVAFSADNRTVALGCGAEVSSPGDVLLFDHVTKQARTIFQGKGGIHGVAFAPDGQTLAMASLDKTVKLYDCKAEQLRPPLRGHKEMVFSVAFAPDGQLLASVGPWGAVHFWDAATGQARGTWQGPPEFLTTAAFAPDGQTLAVGCGMRNMDGLVRLIDVPTRMERGLLRGHADGICAVAFAPDGRTLASGSIDQTVKIWKVSPATLPKNEPIVAMSLSYAPDGATVAVGTAAGEVQIWDAITGKKRQQLKGHKLSVLGVAFAPDGKTLASGEGNFHQSPPCAVKLWNPATGEVRHTLQRHQHSVLALAFSPNGKMLATGGGQAGLPGEIVLWDVASGKFRTALSGARTVVRALAFTPDGKTLVAGCGEESLNVPSAIQVWDIATGNELPALVGHKGRVNSLAFAPDGRTLASGSGDQTVKLWSWPAGKELDTLQGHTRSVSVVAFTPTGRTLLSGSHDNTLKLWQVETSLEIGSVALAGKPIDAMALSPSGRVLALITNWSEELRWLRGPTDQEIAAERKAATEVKQRIAPARPPG